MLGLLNHNWTNIKQNGWSSEYPEKAWKDPWKGSGQSYPYAYKGMEGGTVGWAIYDAQGHAIFQDPVWCIRATCRQLHNYHLLGARTVQEFIGMWAPAVDGNDPDEYVRALLKFDEDLNDIGNKYNLFLDNGSVAKPGLFDDLITAMCRVELYSGFEADNVAVWNGINLYEHDFCK